MAIWPFFFDVFAESVDFFEVRVFLMLDLDELTFEEDILNEWDFLCAVKVVVLIEETLFDFFFSGLRRELLLFMEECVDRCSESPNRTCGINDLD